MIATCRTVVNATHVSLEDDLRHLTDRSISEAMKCVIVLADFPACGMYSPASVVAY